MTDPLERSNGAIRLRMLSTCRGVVLERLGFPTSGLVMQNDFDDAFSTVQHAQRQQGRSFSHATTVSTQIEIHIALLAS